MKPNIVVVQADQMAAQALGAYGDTAARTPHIDRLAEDAAVFDRAYCNTPLCAPSRASMMTGRMPSDLGCHDNGDDFPASIAAYKQFDVLLVNAVMDGLNLVAKEAPIVNRRAGSVVLSVNAGAFEELGDWVIPVDPLDVSATADALEDALALGEDDRLARQQAIRRHVQEHDLEHWIAAQLADLDRASSIRRR